MVARSCGIRTERIIDVTWLISGALCGAAGVALAITTVTFDFTLGPIFLIYMIAAAVLGGIGQPYGAMLGGLVVGVGTQVAAAYTSPAYDVRRQSVQLSLDNGVERPFILSTPRLPNPGVLDLAHP